MSREILGYYSDGEPIYPAESGLVYTQAFIICCRCLTPIRTVGGPAHGSMCLECFKKEDRKEIKSKLGYSRIGLNTVGN